MSLGKRVDSFTEKSSPGKIDNSCFLVSLWSCGIGHNRIYILLLKQY